MTASPPPPSLACRLVDGDVRSLARACRLVDDAVGEYRELLEALFPHTGSAWTIGITGMPGAGKSSLTDKLIGSFRQRGWRVAVLAIDPTSPFSGGAILGDRIRMQRHHADREVFIRSVATRGALGGLSRSAADIIRVLDAWGADVVLVETVGVGQDELEVTTTVDSTVVVTAPGMGDGVQAAKAGILECADILVVNKADREGVDATVCDLELMIALGQPGLVSTPIGGGHTLSHQAQGEVRPRPVAEAGEAAQGEWTPRVVRCVAIKAEGIEELVAGLDAHRQWLRQSPRGRTRRLERLGQAMRQQLRQRLLEHAEQLMGPEIDRAVLQVSRREIDPYAAAEQLIARFHARAGRQG